MKLAKFYGLISRLVLPLNSAVKLGKLDLAAFEQQDNSAYVREDLRHNPEFVVENQ